MTVRARENGFRGAKTASGGIRRRLTCAFILPLLLLPVAGASNAQNASRQCAISDIEGSSVQIERQGSVQTAVRDYSLQPGDRIRTGAASRTEITCRDGTKVTVGPETAIDLGNLAGPADSNRNILIDLFSGIAGFIAPKKNWNSLDVRAPRAIASVRSTEWLVSADAAKTSVFVRKGAVEVSPDGALSSVLQVGQGIDIEQGMRAVSFPVKTWSEERVRQVGAELGFSWQ